MSKRRRSRALSTAQRMAVLTLATSLGLLAGQNTSAQPQSLTVELASPDVLRVGDRTSIQITIRPAGEEALLITPSAEGDAIEVARGRLYRRDGVVQEGALVVQVPIVAARAGHATLAVHVATFDCEEDCRSVEAEAVLALRVQRGS